MTTTPTSGAADLIAAAQAVVDRWGTPLWKDAPATAEYIGRLRAALASAPAQPVAEPADTVVLNAAMRAIQQAIELIGAPTDERMRAVRRVLRGAVIVAEDDGKVAPLPGAAYAALPEYGINTASHAHFRVLGFTADQMRAFADATCALRPSHGQAPAETGNSVSAQADSVQEDADCAWSNYELTAIYNEANGITVKNPPITTERIFAAMRWAAQIAARKQGASHDR